MTITLDEKQTINKIIEDELYYKQRLNEVFKNYEYVYDNTKFIQLAKYVCLNNLKYVIENCDIMNEKSEIFPYNKQKILYLLCEIAAKYSTDINILEFLLDKFKKDTNEYIYYTCFDNAIKINNNVSMIKFLVSKIDKTKINYFCLQNACASNQNLEIIKYLIVDLEINLWVKNTNNDNCLTLACWTNPNLKIIRYLVDEKKMDPMHTDCFNNNCLLIAC